MCLGAIYWARAKAVYYAATRHQAAAAGFDDSLIYREIDTAGSDRQIPFYHLSEDRAVEPFIAWDAFDAKKCY